MSPLTLLIIATVAFVGSHFLMSHPLRAALVGRMGETGFLGFYSLVSLVTLGWMVWVAWTMPAMAPYWVAPPWFFAWAAPVLMLIASILLVGSNIGNPAFPDPSGKAEIVRPATGVFAITRHPMNWAFIIWALTHIALSGSPMNLVVASGILVLTFFGSLLQDKKKEALLGDAWQGWEARTSFIPFGAIAKGRVPLSAAWPGFIPLIGGIILWVAASYFHTMLVGVWAWTA
ncbi:MFS transporter [Parasphingopyxis sp. CP4]|uniref:NnrU family protein n=1 Tax=Parasphingopyxis sp. CP4 TaxID=2724527 RepID=UPI0015A4314A|nr:NnrU family protein [Parasphingopyxis sp. CP4]QLC21018.1 MFS transporter [Parasphingopyxis sp. CP4]